MKILTFIILLFSTMSNAQDFANFGKYQKQNQEIKSKSTTPNSVLMGDSITEGWFATDPEFFTKNNFVGRGIGGQVTSQMLLRFREDVILLKPKRVIILAGTNDIAENQGPISLDKVFGNIVSMVELAKENQIKVVLCSALPASDLIKDYAQKNKITYIDYHTPLKDDKNGLPKEIAEDGIHPNKLGYEKMEAILMKNLK